MRNSLAVAIAFCSAVAACQAQVTAKGANQNSGASMSPPVLGIVPDRSGESVRAITGVVGAALFGNSVALPSAITQFYLAPRQQYALVEARGSTTLGVLPFVAGLPGPIQSLPASMAVPDLVTFSPLGKSAAIYSRESDELQVFSGLPGAPTMVSDIKPSNLPEKPTVMALSDDASTVLAGSPNNDIYLLSGSSAPRLVETVGNLAAIAFVPGTTNAAVYDLSNSSLTLLLSANGTLTPRVIAQNLPITSGAPSIASTLSSGGWVIENAAGKQVLVVDQNGASHAVALPIAPDILQRLANPNLFLVSAQANAPGLVLDMSSEDARFFYIPRSSMAPVTAEAGQ